ncbi:TetR/AcrR family transcriptional regulator [Pseudoxanthomonas sp. SGD-10]|nr:TetR/AcrR family transcriptional regulator [Pseudoxanthomonas sp. SGD-10]
MSEIDEKREKIIETALRRFSHFGLAKTTMNEIAEDLNISKALLYYYFPDKNALFFEVAKNILTGQLEEQSAALMNSENIIDGLLKMIDVRIAFGEKFYMMKIQGVQIDHFISDSRFHELRVDMKDKENILIANFLEEGIKKGELKQIDTEKTAYLLNTIFMGIGMSELYICSDSKSITLSAEVIESFRSKIKDIIQLIYDGIKK